MRGAVVLALAGLACFAATAGADQLAWLSPESAKAVVDRINRDPILVSYCSLCSSERVLVWRVRGATVAPARDPRYFEVRVSVERVFESKRAFAEGEYQEPVEFGPPSARRGASPGVEEVRIDLAYVYARDETGQFRVLGKILGLECSVAVERISVPTDIVGAITGTTKPQSAPLGPPRQRALPGSPEAFAQDYFRSLAAGDLAGAAELMHPDALAATRRALTVLGAADPSGAVLKQLVGIADPRALVVLSDTVLYEMFLRAILKSQPGVVESFRTSALDVIGHLDEGASRTHVVVRMTMKVLGTDVRKMDVLTLQRRGTGWGAMLSGDFENMLLLLSSSAGAGASGLAQGGGAALADDRLQTRASGSSPPQQPIRVGGPIKEPTKIVDVRPVYPDSALKARVQGEVVLECTVSSEGKVIAVQVLRGVSELNDAAVAAVRQWVFTPTLLKGVAVPVIMTVTVTFRLQ